jgi:hypothetical protein
MKKTILLSGLFIILHTCSFAQKQKLKEPAENGNTTLPVKIKNEPRFLLTLHAGYSVALGSTFRFYPDNISSIQVEVLENGPSTKKLSYKSPKKGLGEGVRFGVGLSYVLNDFINVGLDVDYFRSTIRKTKDSSFHQVMTSNPNNSDYRYTERYTIAYDATLITLSPNFTFKAIARPNWYLYNKVGAVFTFRPNSIQKETQDVKATTVAQSGTKDSTAHNEKRYEWGIRNPSFGFMGAIGAQFKVTERIRAFSEVQFSHLVFVVRNRTLTNYKVDGKEMVNTLPMSERVIDFETDFQSQQSPQDPNRPVVAVTERFPITFVGIQFGLAYRF